MKRALLIILLLIPFFGISQTKKPIEGFLGIKFGSSKAAVIAAIKAKGGSMYPEGDEKKIILFRNVTLGTRETRVLFVKFIDNKAYEAIFILVPKLEPKTIEFYNDVVSDINDVYGPGKAYKDFKSPYFEGDGHEISAISGGYADYETQWRSDLSDTSNSMEVSIGSDLSISVRYQDGALIDEAVKRQKEKSNADY